MKLRIRRKKEERVEETQRTGGKRKGRRKIEVERKDGGGEKRKQVRRK